MFFNVGYLAVVPAVVDTPDLVRANSRLETSQTVAKLIGPAVAGMAFQVLGIAALIVDAASFLCSAGSLRMMKPCGGRKSSSEPLGSRLSLGFRVIWKDAGTPSLRGGDPGGEPRRIGISDRSSDIGLRR
ncbi:MAG TPA: hypothetical protein VJT49_07725 [Amycolatopsis sp.]|uniref:hypothetical protein n=1 Tax=Amycolatopsis sp. TaxID=37632 RepID=UPI002B4A2F7C|nr:hypothetical protein [Amycolatopsis sp.]HKS44995.1 hypothetical protein [Amycolatopsis sp.]